jgi:hypothetical protein
MRATSKRWSKHGNLYTKDKIAKLLLAIGVRSSLRI